MNKIFSTDTDITVKRIPVLATFLRLSFSTLLLAAMLLIHANKVFAQNVVPSPTSHVTKASLNLNAEDKLFKIHQWNALDVAKFGTDDYRPRADFNMNITAEAWNNENITSIGLQEICQSTVDSFAAANSISSGNYQFLDYQGNTNDWLVYNEACQTKSGITGDKVGLAIFLRGDPLDKQTFRFTGSAASSWGQRGVPCVKTRYLDRVITACTEHAEFRLNEQDRFAVSRAEAIQYRNFAETVAASGVKNDYIFLPADYNLSPDWPASPDSGASGNPINDPNNLLADRYHGYNVGKTNPTKAPVVRIDHIMFSKSLNYASNTVPLCSGTGIVVEGSVPSYPSGDHCYVGSVAYEVQPNSADSQEQTIPGVPKAGEIINNSIAPLLAAAFFIITGAAYLLYYRRKT